MAHVTHYHTGALVGPGPGDYIVFTVDVAHGVLAGDSFDVSGTGTPADASGYTAESVDATHVVYHDSVGGAFAESGVDVDGTLTITGHPTPTTTFREAVTAVIVALAPAFNDSSGLLFREVDDFIEEKGNGRHREFVWRNAKKAALVSEHEEQFEWSPMMLELVLYRTPPGRADRTYKTFVNAVECDAVQIAKAISRMGSAQFPTTTREPELVGFEIEEREFEKPKDGLIPRPKLAVVRFNFKLLTQENG